MILLIIKQKTRVEGLSKNEKGLMDMDNSVVTAVGRGVKGLNGNRKKYNED